MVVMVIKDLSLIYRVNIEGHQKHINFVIDLYDIGKKIYIPLEKNKVGNIRRKVLKKVKRMVQE